MKKFLSFPSFFFVLIFVFSSYSFSQEERLYLISKGQYFSIYGYKGLDISYLLQKLNFSYLQYIGVLSQSRDLKTTLANTIDAIYLEVSDILDIHMYSYHGKIYIFPDKSYISAVFKKYFGKEFPERSFYLHPRNAIYISFSDLTLGMLSHEIAHAIISHYFVVPPPTKVQEVLCGYVEYIVRKKRGLIPR